MELLSCGDRRLSPPLTKYPCLVAHTLEADQEDKQLLYTIHDPLIQYPCRIPELHSRRFEGCFHDWVVLSSFPKRCMWSIWNPSTSKIISLPPLILEDGNYKSLGQCCLTSAPDDPNSVLLLTRYDKPTILLCRLDGKRDGRIKSLRWTKISYAKQLKSVTDEDHCVLSSLTSCDGKVYALNSGRRNNFVIKLRLAVKDRVVIKLSPYGKLPNSSFHGCCSSLTRHLIGSSSELFYILLGFDKVANKSLAVYLFKLEKTSMIWEEMEDLKDAIFFLDLSYDHSMFYKPGIASEFGGYIHILGEMGNVMYSYHIKDKTVSISSMPSIASTSYISLWECRIQEEGKKDETMVGNACGNDNSSTSTRNERHEENIESYLLSIPSNVLETIMDFCVGVDYLNFRTTCKSCQLAAPMIRFINRMRLETNSLDSPWLLVLDKHREILTFTDPMFGENYFIKTPPGLIGDVKIHCSRYGWLLMEKYGGPLVFYNPFTSVIHELPQVFHELIPQLGHEFPQVIHEVRQVPCLETLCFSAPPTSPDCMVVGYRTRNTILEGYVHYVARQPARWRKILVSFGCYGPQSLHYPIFHGRCLYVLLDDGRVYYFRLAEGRSLSSAIFLACAPRSCCGSSPQYFLVERDQHLLLVIVGEFGESIEVFKLNDSTEKWEKIDSLGRHMIYICGQTCLCIKAKTPEMENKIYFPRLHSGNGKIVFYSLQTHSYHTFNDRDIEENFGDFFGTKYHLYPHAWIEPSWL